jgi:hypothetical protein
MRPLLMMALTSILFLGTLHARAVASASTELILPRRKIPTRQAG